MERDFGHSVSGLGPKQTGGRRGAGDRARASERPRRRSIRTALSRGLAVLNASRPRSPIGWCASTAGRREVREPADRSEPAITGARRHRDGDGDRARRPRRRRPRARRRRLGPRPAAAAARRRTSTSRSSACPPTACSRCSREFGRVEHRRRELHGLQGRRTSTCRCRAASRRVGRGHRAFDVDGRPRRCRSRRRRGAATSRSTRSPGIR